MTGITVALLEASAQLAAAHTRIAQVCEHGNPSPKLGGALVGVMQDIFAAQLALSDAIQPVPPGRGWIAEVRA